MTKRFFVVLAPAALLIASSCGGDSAGDGGSSGDSDLRGAISTAFVDNIETEGVDFKADATLGDCVADSLLENETYASNLQAAFDKGLSGQDLLDSAGDTESDVEITRKIFTCFTSEQLAILLSGQAGDAGTNTEENRKCLADEFEKVDRDELVDGIFALNSEDTAAQGSSVIAEALTLCFGLDTSG